MSESGGPENGSEGTAGGGCAAAAAAAAARGSGRRGPSPAGMDAGVWQPWTATSDGGRVEGVPEPGRSTSATTAGNRTSGLIKAAGMHDIDHWYRSLGSKGLPGRRREVKFAWVNLPAADPWARPGEPNRQTRCVRSAASHRERRVRGPDRVPPPGGRRRRQPPTRKPSRRSTVNRPGGGGQGGEPGAGPGGAAKRPGRAASPGRARPTPYLERRKACGERRGCGGVVVAVACVLNESRSAVGCDLEAWASAVSWAVAGSTR